MVKFQMWDGTRLQAGHAVHGGRPRDGAQDGRGDRRQVRGGEEDHAARLRRRKASRARRSSASPARPGRRSTRAPRRTRRTTMSTEPQPATPRVPLGQQHRGHLRPRDPRAEGRVARGAAGPHRRAARRERRRQDDDAEGDLQSAARRARRSDQGHDRVHGQARRPADAERARAHGRVPGDGRPPLLPAPDGRGEPADRRVHAQRHRARELARGARLGLHVFPAAQGAARRARRATPPAASSR